MNRSKPFDNVHARENAERVYREWDQALSDNDADALIALDAPTRSSRAH